MTAPSDNGGAEGPHALRSLFSGNQETDPQDERSILSKSPKSLIVNFFLINPLDAKRVQEVHLILAISLSQYLFGIKIGAISKHEASPSNTDDLI